MVGSKRGPSVLQPYRDPAKLRPAQSMAPRTVNSQGSRRTSGPASVRTRRVCAGQGVTGGCLLLCNESFASTNEREGSEIARQIVRALLESGVRVFFVTHLFDLAHSFHAEKADSALFLRPERCDDGERTFRVLAGEPLPTSYGPDLYWEIFGAEPEAAAAGPRAGK